MHLILDDPAGNSYIQVCACLHHFLHTDPIPSQTCKFINVLVLTRNLFCLLLQNVYAPEQDPEMSSEHYERSFAQNELLGLNDMKTEDYSSLA